MRPFRLEKLSTKNVECIHTQRAAALHENWFKNYYFVSTIRVIGMPYFDSPIKILVACRKFQVALIIKHTRYARQ